MKKMIRAFQEDMQSPVNQGLYAGVLYTRDSDGTYHFQYGNNTFYAESADMAEFLIDLLVQHLYSEKRLAELFG